MSADNRPRLCVNCDFCPSHGGRDVITIDKNGMLTTTFEDVVVRTCGAGNTSDPNAHCENNKFKVRNTVIVYQFPPDIQTALEKTT